MSFHEEYHKWHSPAINRDFEMLTFGHAGYPVILGSRSADKAVLATRGRRLDERRGQTDVRGGLLRRRAETPSDRRPPV